MRKRNEPELAGCEEALRERLVMNWRWGELADKMGTVVEDLVSIASCRSC